MLFYLFVFFVCYLDASFSCNGEDHLEKQEMETIALTFQGFAREGSEAIWPQFDLLDRPTLFHFSHGHVYAYGLKSPSHFWEKKIIQQLPLLFTSQFSGSLPLLHPAYLLENERAFLIGLDHGRDGSFIPLLTFIHERFHITQFECFDKERVVEADLSDYDNIEILALMEMEHILLTSFLQADDAKIKRNHLEDYVAMSHYRRQLLHSATLCWENHQQKMEGLADYVSVKTFEVFPFIPHFKAEDVLIEMRQKKHQGIVTTQDALKSRHYFVGAVLGRALDFCEVQKWKEWIQRRNISLQEILESVLKIDEQDLKERFFQLKESLGWKKIVLDIEENVYKEKKIHEEVMHSFIEREGVLIEMGTPSGPMSSGGSHQKKYQIDRQMVLMHDVSFATTQDQMWTLRFMAIPMIVEQLNGDRIFKLEGQTHLMLDGQIFSLEELVKNDQKEFKFHSLFLKHQYCELNSHRSGILSVKGTRVSFKFF